jgi:hypothetical protein
MCIKLRILYINFWNNNGDIQDRWFTHFLEENLNISLTEIDENETPDILISSCMGDLNIVKKYNSKLKIFFYGENLNRYSKFNNFEELYNIFDLIIGFKYTDKAKKVYRLPLWITYYPFYNMDSETNILNYIQNEYSKNIKNKNNDCCLIARHDRGGQRTKIYNEVIKYCNIKCPSTFKRNCEPLGKNVKDKIDFLKRFRYNICPENSKYEGYFTEKIFQSLESGCIPIYWGIDLPEKNIINRQCYCFINVDSENDIKSQIKNLFENNDNFICDKIFCEGAKEIVDTYYRDIIMRIKNILKM